MSTRAHPYMANSVPAIKQEMLEVVGAGSIEELFAQIPESHRIRGELELPPTLASELELYRHLRDVLGRNESCQDEPQLPRRRLLAAPRPRGLRRDRRPQRVRHAGLGHALRPTTAATRRGSSSARSWASSLALDFVGLPVYSWGCAAGHAIRMAARLTGRHEVLVPRSLDPERLAVIRTYCGAARDGRPHRGDARRRRPRHRPGRPRRPDGEALRPRRSRLPRDAVVPRRDRGRRGRDRTARACGTAPR